MKYGTVVPGRFLARPNRFIAHVELEGGTQICHVKNTGRCRELLVPGARVYLEDFGPDTRRKTRYDLIAVEKGDLLINMDSQAPNKAVGEFLRAGGLWEAPTLVRPETKWGNSRFDFYLEQGDRKAFLEVKGVTLEEKGLALFPDAPTLRGVKHLEELAAAAKAGYEAYALFLIQMKGVRTFRPNWALHPQFGQALADAAAAGVTALAYDCRVTPDSMVLDAPVPLDLTPPGEKF